ncbi:MAG: hypothetical protein NWE94_03125, partial [Candidatus Bathyarchaeota archaeon]|nr:hypothetical protein [Candidatus Bathyarchaeota archaeon]
MRAEVWMLLSLLLIMVVASPAFNAVHAMGVVATITMEKPGGCYGVAYDSGKGEIYITNWGANTVSVISDSNHTVIATIPVGNNPRGVTYDSA